MENNPFSALLGGFGASPPVIGDTSNRQKDVDSSIMNDMIENIFFITIDNVKRHSKQLVYLQEIASAAVPGGEIDVDLLGQALFERLLLQNPSDSVVPAGCKDFDKNVIERDVLLYLYNADQNMLAYENTNDPMKIEAIKKMREFILVNAVTALKQPEVFGEQIVCDQLFYIVKNNFSTCQRFVNDVINAYMADDTSASDLKSIIFPVMKLIQIEILKSDLLSLNAYIYPTITMFIENSHIINIFVECSQPIKIGNNYSYQNTLLGSLLCLSALPKTLSSTQEYPYFQTPLDKSACSIEENGIWTATNTLLSILHKIFWALLKHNTKTKNELLDWIGDCLHINSMRGKIWNTHLQDSATVRGFVSDGFMINLCTVLLMLCQPFCLPSNDKYLKLDPTYCAVEEANCKAKGVHMKKMSEETCLIPPKEVYEGEEAPKRLTVDNYNFMTECFFMTHKALDLGYGVMVEKLLKLSQDIGQLRESFSDLMNGINSDIFSILNARLKTLMTRLVSVRCALREPQLESLLINFHVCTCKWLVQLAIHNNSTEVKNSTLAPLSFVELKFPMSEEEPDVLRSVPEFLVENIFSFMSVHSIIRTTITENQELDLLEPVLSLVLVFMGSSKKMRNPHLRARLAECLSKLLPNPSQEEFPINSVSSFVREKLFKEHAHRLQIVPALLNVFVGIEVTGESVQFEQKFNYRRPMYLIMDYLWTLEEHRECFKKLSEEAEANMEAVNPPIFLRFINLLMNDAVFLLDESLNNMSQIRTMQAVSETDLRQRSTTENEEHYMNLQYVGMLARFDNILGRHTISTLEHLTSEIKSVFCHPTMVDRIAAMLNYFLLHLVGPNQKNFKVKDFKEYKFDPVATVLDISKIYIHLGSDDKFCLAVSQDGRSYSPQLFKLAENVLVRITGGGELISSLIEVAEQVSRLGRRQLEEEEVLGDAPEEFLDPIMSTLMYDPVILPSSKITIDRTTIARHLLSDQSDPFNRSPLTMDQVKSNEELKLKILDWVEEKRKEHRSKDLNN